MRAVALAAVSAVTILAGGLPTAAQAPPDQWTEFPAYERAVVSLLRTGDRVKRARQQLVVAHSAPETLELLLQADMVADAVKILPEALAGDGEQILRALRALMSNAWMFTLDDTRGHRDAIRRAVEPVRARVAATSAEDAARAAFVLMSFDNWISPQDSRNWTARLSEFVKQDAGTEAALLAEVDALSMDAPLLRRLEPLEQFWRDHPGTTAGAKALYRSAFTSTRSTCSRRGAAIPPTGLRVADVVRELESGRYPRSEWVDRAPSMMIGFFISSSPGPTYAPGNVERALETFERFVMTHFADASPDVDNGIGYLIASKMADLYERQGDRIGGVEGLLTRLEAQPAQRQAARRLRASFYLRQWTAGAEPVRPQMGARARATFEALAAEGTEPGASHSLASLAAMAYYERDYARAIPIYRRYVDTYPRSWYHGWR